MTTEQWVAVVFVLVVVPMLVEVWPQVGGWLLLIMVLALLVREQRAGQL